MAEHQDAIARIKALCLELRLALEELDDSPVPSPANITSIKRDEEEYQGMIARPELKVVRGKQLFTAGLKVREGDADVWLNVVGWGQLAEAASTLNRGQIVRVVGKTKESSFVDSNGVVRTKRELTASLISPVILATGASSVNTA